MLGPVQEISAALAFEKLVTDKILIDVRSESEFLSSHFTGSINMPLLNNAERAEVGLTYKTKGPDAALALGHQLVSGNKKTERIEGWIAALRQGAHGLFCARGGLRSQIACNWIRDSGHALPRVKGGYKALRQISLEKLQSLDNFTFLILSGPTGSGKTEIIRAWAQEYAVIDLEGLAAHRGSSFGRTPKTQPAQATFENLLALALERCKIKTLNARGPLVPTTFSNHGLGPLDSQIIVILEDESQNIGSLRLPNSWYEKMKTSTRLHRDAPIEERVARILKEYIEDHLTNDKVDITTCANEMKDAVTRIRKKLGGLRTSEALALISDAFDLHQQQNELSLHRKWIHYLLVNYYDPLYQQHLKVKSLPSPTTN